MPALAGRTPPQKLNTTCFSTKSLSVVGPMSVIAVKTDGSPFRLFRPVLRKTEAAEAVQDPAVKKSFDDLQATRETITSQLAALFEVPDVVAHYCQRTTSSWETIH